MAFYSNPVTRLHLDIVDAAQARDYNRAQRWLLVIDSAVNFLVLVILLFTGWSSVLRDWSLKLSRNGFSLGLLFYFAMFTMLLKLAGIAIELRGFRLEHHFHLTDQKLGAWLWDSTKEYLLTLLLGGIAVETVYFIIRQTGVYWWVWSWLVFTVLFVVLAQLAPVLLLPLFYKFTPLEDTELKARLQQLTEKAGLRVRGVYEWKLSEKSNKANAALTGMGMTRRILLADTLLSRYTPDEIEAVLAHELGHHAHNHILRGIAVQSIASLAGFFVAAQALEFAVHGDLGVQLNFSGLHDFADLPVLLLASGIISLLLKPVLNAWSRLCERQADTFCWRSIADVAPYISAMEKLEEQNLAEREPPRWIEVLFHSHPSLGRRLTAARAYASSHKK